MGECYGFFIPALNNLPGLADDAARAGGPIAFCDQDVTDSGNSAQYNPN